MEQQSYQGGDHQQDQLQEQPPAEVEKRLTDEHIIHYNITEALREERPIDHATARAIAAQLHGGQASLLYALASSGALVEGVRDELDIWRTSPEAGVELEPWLDALDEYLDSRAEQPGPVEDWSQLWPSQPPSREDDEPGNGKEERLPYDGSSTGTIGRTAVNAALPVEQAEDDEATARQALFERISAAGVTTLGQIATGHALDQEDESEPDPFPWTDAATWSPALAVREEAVKPQYTPAELAALFAEPPDEELGSVDELGWYGLVRHEGRPGGLILRCDEHGFRRVVGDARTDEALDALWAILQQEYKTYYDQRDAYEQATEWVADGPSGYSPRIWVGSLADYNNGHLHGAWMDATLEPEELHAATQFLLRTGNTSGAEEWAIFDHEDFGDYNVTEWSSFDTVSLIAQGIAEHGPAYAAWVNYIGDTSGQLLEPDRFRDHYLGEWDSLEDYVEDVLQETEFYRNLDEALEQAIPEDLRRHVKVDLEGIAEEWEQELYVVERPEGGVWVFTVQT